MDVIKFSHPSSDISLIFDDDRKVAYAYLAKREKLVADVWLYNHGQPPVATEWDECPDGMPFINSSEFASSQEFIPVTSQNELNVIWLKDFSGMVEVAELYIRNQLHTQIKLSDEPGEFLLATKDGLIVMVSH